MTTLHFTKTTTATPEELLTALTDFGPGRSDVFPNSHDDQLQVHDRGTDYADVTEGGGGAWERLHYDWSDPRHIKLTTVDSNLFGGASGHTYTLTPQPDGTTEIDAVLVREGKNLRGRVIASFIGTVGRRSLTKAFAGTVKAIEARSNADAVERP